MNEKLYQTKEEFLKEWPFSRIKEMVIDEYTNLEKTSFTYWIEAKTSTLGSIWGGSAYKFGIYRRRDVTTPVADRHRKTDGEYAWFEKYGITRSEAFETVKAKILFIIEAVQNDQLEKIDDVDLGDAYKWKIAFLYGNFNVVNIFKNDSLFEAAQSIKYKGDNKSYSTLNRYILERKDSSLDYFDYTSDLWKKTSLANPKKYWLYAPGENAYRWKEFYDDGIIGLGWDALGDLDNYKTKDKIQAKLQELEDVTNSKKNDTTANYDFYKSINIGDVIIVKKGVSELLGYGIVDSDYYYDDERTTYQKCRKVNWKLTGNWKLEFSLPIKTLTDVTKYNSEDPNYSKYYEKLMSIMEGDTVTLKEDKDIVTPINQILYGPPGTGKTYHTVNKSLSIIENKSEEILKSEERSELKRRYDQYVKDGQIVLTTFHQSMNYEDFIEGIKPQEPEKDGDPVIYKTKYGILRNICIEACFDIAHSIKNDNTENALDFSYLYDKFIVDIEEKLINGDTIELEIKTGAKVLVDSISQNGNIIIKHIDGNRTYTVSKNRLSKLYSEIKNLDDIVNIAIEFKSIIGGSNSSAYWSVLNAIRKAKNNNSENKDKRKYTFEEKKEVVLSLSKTDYKNKNGKPFVLIIDEINRGNVSQIFGELITLIEENKRLGKIEDLEVTLPYSNDKFGVPPNLYIIGTMNTADRSVEALDTALRRRFCFEEIPPLYNLIGLENKVFDFTSGEILKTINKRIVRLLSNDHAIGHSYFLNKDEDTIIESFYKNIIPLLQEYFFGDYSKIMLVLGNGFVQYDEWKDEEKFFASCNNSNDDYDPKDIYSIRDYQKDKEGFKQALIKLMNR